MRTDASRRRSMPRAGIGVSIINDPDYITLMRTASGRQAFAGFVGLLVAAKELDNGGDFGALSLDDIADLIRWPRRALSGAVLTLGAHLKSRKSAEWIQTAPRIVVRTYELWNPPRSENWGGARAGAGRPSDLNTDPMIQLEKHPAGTGTGTVKVLSSPGGSGGERPDMLLRLMHPVLAEFWPRIPERYRAAPTEVNAALVAAEHRGADPRMVLERFLAYTGSPLGCSQFGGTLANWIRRGRWADSPAAWQTQKHKARGLRQ